MSQRSNDSLEQLHFAQSVKKCLMLGKMRIFQFTTILKLKIGKDEGKGGRVGCRMVFDSFFFS